MAKKTEIKELDPAVLEAESQKAQEALKAQQESEPKGKTYTEDEVRGMLQQVMKDNKNPDDIDAEDTPEVKKCTIPRFQNKFVVAFKNINTDSYSDKPKYAFDLFDEQTRQNVPNVTLIFDDKSELTVPLNTALDYSNKITCELLEVKEVDASYDFGKVEKQEVRDGNYTKSGTGVMVKTKVTQKIYSYVVKLPEPDGRTIEVSRDVMNWSVATVK